MSFKTWGLKLWAQTGRLSALIVLGLISVGTIPLTADNPPQHLEWLFEDRVLCTIRGRIYANPEEGWELVRADTCGQVGHRIVEANILELFTEHWTVHVLLPFEGGWQDFSYRWGSVRAFIGGEPVRVFIQKNMVAHA